MHRDTKLGLALGMLVIGFAVAFCFPRDPTSTSSTTTTPVVVNPELAFIPIRAYPDEVVAPPEVSATSNDAANSSTATTASEVAASTSASSPSAISSSATAVPMAAQTLTDVADVRTDTPMAPPTAPPVSEASRTHRVEFGDTLSGIAQRYLGSSLDYYDVFSANQDQLSTPDALLRVGMVLKIPEIRPAADKSKALDGRALSSGDSVANGTSEPSPTLALPERHTVKRGDTLEGIARRYYGDPSLVSQLRAANPHVSDPQRLAVGSQIDLPVVR